MSGSRCHDGEGEQYHDRGDVDTGEHRVTLAGEGGLDGLHRGEVAVEDQAVPDQDDDLNDMQVAGEAP